MFGLSRAEKRKRLGTELARAIQEKLDFNAHVTVDESGDIRVFAKSYIVRSLDAFKEASNKSGKAREQLIDSKSRIYATELNGKAKEIKIALDAHRRGNLQTAPTDNRPEVSDDETAPTMQRVNKSSVVWAVAIACLVLLAISLDVITLGPRNQLDAPTKQVSVPSEKGLQNFGVGVLVTVTGVVGFAVVWLLVKGRTVPMFLQFAILLMVLTTIWHLADGKSDSLMSFISEIWPNLFPKES